jgi:hypothetical protein
VILRLRHPHFSHGTRELADQDVRAPFLTDKPVEVTTSGV